MYKIKVERKLIDMRLDNTSYLTDHNQNILTFKTLEEAISELEYRGICIPITKQTYIHDYYVTQWGEYDRPLYHIRKIKHTGNK